MNVCGRLTDLFQYLQQQDIREANKFRAEVEKAFSRNGLPPSLMHYLHVLDTTPWKDYQKSSSQVYTMAGKQVIEAVLYAANESRSDQPNLDLRPDECIRKIKDYVTLGSYEEFAVKVQHLMMHLDQLVIDFPNRPKACQAMEQDLTIKDQIDGLSQFVTGTIAPMQEEMRKNRERYEEGKNEFKEMSQVHKQRLEQQHGRPLQDLIHDYQQKWKIENLEMENQMKGYEQNFRREATSMCNSLREQIGIVINEIEKQRLNLKNNRFHQLKPVLPPVENLNELNRRCCEIFEFLQKLENVSVSDDINKRIWHLKRELFQNVFVVELQPPPVLKLESKGESTKVKPEKDGARRKIKTENNPRQESKHESKFFSIGVRILGAASFVDLQVAADQLKFTVHIEKDQIEQVMSSPGHVDKSQCFCPLNVGNKKKDGNALEPRSNFRRICEKMKLIHVPKPEDSHRQLFENVTDKKCAIIMSVPVANIVVKVLCEPVVLTTATVQTGPALGTIFWDAAFSQLKRKCYEEKDEVLWSELSRAIEELFNNYIPNAPLTEQQLHSIALHLFKGEGNGIMKNFADQKISRRDFMKEPKVEDSHWRWMFSCLNLIRQDPHDKNWEGLAEFWQNGLILGFVTKVEAEEIIRQECPGTFLIRFRDTGIEKSNRDCPRASLSVVYRKTDDGKVLHVCDKLKAADIQSSKLANCLQQLKNGNREGIQLLYPIGKTFDEAFGEFIEEGNPDDGYARLVSILVPPDKNLNHNQVTLGGFESTENNLLNQDLHQTRCTNASTPLGSMHMAGGTLYTTSPVSPPQPQDMAISENKHMTLKTQPVTFSYMTQSPNDYYTRISSPGACSACDVPGHSSMVLPESVHSPQSIIRQSPGPVSPPQIVHMQMSGSAQMLGCMSPPRSVDVSPYTNPVSPENLMNLSLSDNQGQVQGSPPDVIDSIPSPQRYNRSSPDCITLRRADASDQIFGESMSDDSPSGHSNFVEHVMRNQHIPDRVESNNALSDLNNLNFEELREFSSPYSNPMTI